MTWGSNIFPLLIVSAGGGFQGLFVYAPAPGPGNLIASVAGHSGTDPYGNAYVNSFGSYAGGGTIQGQMQGDQLVLQRISGGLATPQIQLLDDVTVTTTYVRNNEIITPLIRLGTTTTAAKLSSDATGWPTATDKAGIGPLQMSTMGLNNVTTALVNTTGVKTLGSLSVPANDVETGSSFLIHASGAFTTGTTPSSATFQVFWGISPIGTLAIPTITAGLAGAGWIVDASVDWISTTQVEVALEVWWHTAAGVIGSTNWFTIGNTGSMDTTVTQNLILAFAWGSVPGATQLITDVVRIGRLG